MNLSTLDSHTSPNPLSSPLFALEDLLLRARAIELELSAGLRNSMAGSDRPMAHQGLVVLIDGASLFASAAALGFEVDYDKLLRVLAHERKLLQAIFYTGVSSGNQRQQAFLHWMQNHGYRVVSKELSIAADGSRKADLSVELAIDMILYASQCDVLVLVTHNENLAYAMNAAGNRGVQIELLGLRQWITPELMNLSDRFINIEMIRAEIQRQVEP